MGLTNLLAGREIQQEFQLNHSKPQDMARAFDHLLSNTAVRAQVRQDQFEALKSLEIRDGLVLASAWRG